MPQVKEAFIAQLHQMTSENEQVGRHDGGAHLGGKRGSTSPYAASQSEDTFEERDDALNTGAEVAQLFVDSAARGHILDRESTLFGEDHPRHLLSQAQVLLAAIR